MAGHGQQPSAVAVFAGGRRVFDSRLDLRPLGQVRAAAMASNNGLVVGYSLVNEAHTLASISLRTCSRSDFAIGVKVTPRRLSSSVAALPFSAAIPRSYVVASVAALRNAGRISAGTLLRPPFRGHQPLPP